MLHFMKMYYYVHHKNVIEWHLRLSAANPPPRIILTAAIS